MNKELIKTYKAEFDHWLNGGTLLYRHFDYIKQKFTEWEKCNMEFPWNTSGIYTPCIIINDKFVEFRKALAEGKTVQYNFGNHGINKKDFPNEWKDLDQSIGILADRACPENYRIKPEESKFKVGDWITDGIEVWQHKENCRVKNQTSWSLWKPKPGEWCWFYQNKREIPTLGNLKHFSDKDSFCAYSTPKASMSVKYFKHCEPFLGQLPTNLQDIK